VPAGTITFTPDSVKGNSGPQGFARIIDGRYTTAARDGKGTVGGPHLVTVWGFDGIEPTETDPNGQRLFAEFQTARDLAQRSLDAGLERAVMQWCDDHTFLKKSRNFWNLSILPVAPIDPGN
jgi:hypothetical protein